MHSTRNDLLVDQELFIYGSLKCPRCQEEVFGRVAEQVPDGLRGFRRAKIRLGRAQYPIIRPTPDGHVEGFRIAVSAAELARIDAYETSAYRRSRVTLESGREAWVYHG